MTRPKPLPEKMAEILLLRTAIAHARQRLAAWLEPEGMPAERCLDELLELFFHPALDESAATKPGEPSLAEMLRQAVRDSREILLRHFGGTCDIEGDRCLGALLVPLDNQYLVEAGGFADLFTAELLDQKACSMLLIRSKAHRHPPTFH